MTSPIATTLGRVIDEIGATVLDAALGIVDAGAPVTGLVVYDPYEPAAATENAVVVGVGVASADQLVELLEECAGATAVVVRAPVPVSNDARSVAGRMPVLGVSGLAWAQVVARIARTLEAAQLATADDAVLGASGDLFALANGISAMVDDSITIEDLNSHVIAFSADQSRTDDYRRATVLDRHVDTRIAQSLRADGVFSEIYRAERPVVFDDLGLPDPMQPRAVMPIRANSELLGSIWVTLSSPLTSDREQTLIEAARQVALPLLRLRLARDGDERVRAGVVGTLLGGGAEARDLSVRLSQFAGAACVIAVSIRTDSGLGDADLEHALQRLSRSVEMLMLSLHPRAVSSRIGDVVYGILPRTGSEGVPRAALVRFVESLSTTGHVIVGIGETVDHPTQLARSREDANQVLRALKTRTGTTADSRVASLEQVQTDVLLQQLSDRLAADGRRPGGVITQLQLHDGQSGTDLLESLRVWLDHLGDTVRAAGALHIHPNTLRYRLRRIEEITHIDLADADTRFSVQLQLRLLV